MSDEALERELDKIREAVEKLGREFETRHPMHFLNVSYSTSKIEVTGMMDRAPRYRSWNPSIEVVAKIGVRQ